MARRVERHLRGLHLGIVIEGVLPPDDA